MPKQDLLPVCVRKKTHLLIGYQYYTRQSLIEFSYFPLIHLVAQDEIEKTLEYSEVTSQCYLTVETHINTKYHLSFT